MKRAGMVKALAAVVAVQVLVLCAMVVHAGMPLWSGIEIRVKTIPVDPRSMFRGNYALLNYEFSRLPEQALDGEGGLRVGEVVYVSLAPDEDGLYGFATASLQRPANGVYIRGRLQTVYRPFSVKYGIEAWFAPKEKALQLEKDLRGGGVAVLMVGSNGRAALKNIVPENN